MDNEKLEDFQQRVKRDRKRYNKIVAWHLQAFSTAGITLPYTPDTTYISVEHKNPVYEDYKKPVEVDPTNPATAKGWEYCWDTTLDVPQIIETLSNVAKFARSQGYKIEKDYDNNFSLKVTLPGVKDDDTDKDVTLHYYCDREAVCVARPTGQFKITPAHTTPERVEEIVEWDCQKIAFTA
jgi:hypothetical protein